MVQSPVVALPADEQGTEFMKLLITGGSGGIGTYVVAELAQAGHEVISFDRQLPQDPQQAWTARQRGINYRIGDHEDLGNLLEVSASVDAIVHLSAIPAPGTYPNTTVFRTNALGTFNVHEAAAICGVPLVVSTSSQSAYGFAYQHRPFLPQYLPLDEEHPDLSQDSYGLSKMVGEQLAHGFHRRNGMRVCSIRPPWVTLPFFYTQEWFRGMLAPKEWNGSLFSYVDVRDLAAVYRMVVEAPAELIQDEVFNVAADDALALEPLAELLPRLDPGLAPLAASIPGGRSMVSAERIKQRLGWAPRYSWRQFIAL
jgi:nucleoside-diphosphate-sugar epimerase